MNREQMEAWCALEGLVPATFIVGTTSWRIIPQDYFIHKYKTAIASNDPSDRRGWRIQYVVNVDYNRIDWHMIPDSDWEGLTIELLTELTKK